jgi:hypothetical protein
MRRNPLDWKELRNILIVVGLCMIVISFVDFSDADISRVSILTVVFLLYVAYVMRRQNTL